MVLVQLQRRRRKIQLRLGRIRGLFREDGVMGVVDYARGAARKGYGVVAMLAFVCGDHYRGVLRRALDALLHRALAVRASVVASAN